MGSISPPNDSLNGHTSLPLSETKASIHFLRRLPLYKVEKPYTIRYQLPSDSTIPRTNSEHEEIHDITVVRISPVSHSHLPIEVKPYLNPHSPPIAHSPTDN